MRPVFVILAATLAWPALAAAQPTAVPASDVLTVLPVRSPARKGTGPLRDHLRREALAALDRRRETFEALRTPDAIRNHQRELRARFIASLGGFPDRTPLNARVVGEIRGEGFRIEKVLFESAPGFVVSGLLYLPASGTAPHPVVLMPCGHSDNGKAAYQAPAMLLARHGLAVFCFDPIGQGERRQLPPDTAFGRRGGPPVPLNATSEHTILSVAPILLGRGLAAHMIWDGIRAIDYLTTRPDLDPKRIACSGNSGGGMMTSYLMALDERIVAAAPGCFMTTSARKNESPGPGDAEQNIFGQYAYGLDLPDFITLAAPRPVVILAATRDYVPIAGAWEAFRDAKRLYARFGHPERIDLVETDATHGFSLQLREGTVRWMRRWLCDDQDAIFEQAVPALPDAQLACSPDGRVLALPDSRSLSELNRAEAARLAPLRRDAWGRLADSDRRALVRATARIQDTGTLPRARVETHGELRRGNIRIEKLVFARDADVPLPALRFRSERPSERTVLYLHGRGKHVDAAPGGPIEKLVTAGAEVIAVDLRGFGETAMDAWRTNPAEVAGVNGAEYHLAYLLGRSLVGFRAEDVLVAARACASLPGAAAGPLELIAVEGAAIPALHAAAVAPGLFSSATLVRALDSWERVLDAEVPLNQLESTVHGALRAYDLPDLIVLAGRVVMTEPVDATGRLLAR